MSQRITYFDTAKGICIILVVAFHSELHFNEATDNVLSYMRMPLYYFLSGVFFKLYDGYADFIRRKVNRLLIPFLFFYVITSVALPTLFHGVFGYHVNTVVGWRSLYAFIYPEQFPNIPIWFLWSLFLANIMFYAMLLSVRRSVWWLTLSVGIIIVAGYALRYFNINLPAFVDDTLLFLPFFFAGYICHRADVLSVSISRLTAVFIAVPALCVAYMLANAQGESFVVEMLAYYIACLSCIAVVVMLSQRLGRLPVVTYYGRYSIILLVTHCLVLQAVGHFVVWLEIAERFSSITVFVLTLVSYQLIIPVMKCYLPYFTAQKDLI